VHKTTLSAYFDDQSQILSLNDSAIAAMSRRKEEDLGREDLAYTLAEAYGAPRWVSFNATSEPYRAIPQGLVSFGKTNTFGFKLEHAGFVSAKYLEGGVPLVSIASTAGGNIGDSTLPPSERSRNDRSYASFVARPQQLLWKKVELLQLDYQFIAKTM